jgi:hypothetical protein
MLTTKETVSGVRKINNLVDDLVKQLPDYTHRQIAELLVEEWNGTLDKLAGEIAEAKAEGKNPFQKAGSVTRMAKYAPVLDQIVKMLVELGKPQIVETSAAAEAETPEAIAA